MLILRSSPSSPFGRKIKMALALTGQSNNVRIELANTTDPSDSLRQQNPLGKIPILILQDVTALFDSTVIVEYLNEVEGRDTLIPKGQRIAVLRQQALADGLVDAAILQVYEKRFRPAEHHVQSWVDHQQGKVARTLDFMEQATSAPGTGVPHIGEIAQAVALGYQDFRFGGTWRNTHPKLVTWLADFAQRVPAFAETAPHD
jgi:glutathione S-transferase